MSAHELTLPSQQLKCECHECTQARWKQTLQYQLERAMTSTQPRNPYQEALALDDLKCRVGEQWPEAIKQPTFPNG